MRWQYRRYDSDTTPSFMALAIDAARARPYTNEMCLKLQPKKTKVRLYNAVTIAAKGVLYALYYQQDGAWPLPSI